MTSTYSAQGSEVTAQFVAVCLGGVVWGHSSVKGGREGV